MPSNWTQRQRRIAILLIALLLVVMSVQVWHNRAEVPDPPPAESSRGDEIADRLDPNTADAEALSAIPNLGEKRAKDVVDYRTTFAAQYPGQLAFTQPEDLMRIKGIGAGTVANMRPFLTFSKPGSRRTQNAQ